MENEKLIEEAKERAKTLHAYARSRAVERLNSAGTEILAEMIDSLITALEAATKELEKKETQIVFAWVVEHAESEQSRPRYFDGIGWSDPGDNEAAIRFAREKDARFFANKLDWPNVHRVCEHGWDEQIAAALSPAKSTEAEDAGSEVKDVNG